MSFPNEYSSLILASILTVLIVIKIGMDKSSVWGISIKNNPFKKSNTSMIILGYTILGIVVGILMSPLNLGTTDTEWWYWFRNSLILFFINIFPFVTLTGAAVDPKIFFYSNYYFNMGEFVIGIWLGIGIGFGCQQIPSQKQLGPFIINPTFFYIIFSLLILWSIIWVVGSIFFKKNLQNATKIIQYIPPR